MDNYNDYVNGYMNNYNCPDCNDSKLQSDKNARKINEVIDQVNALIQVNNETVDFIEEKTNEVVEEIAEIKVSEVIGDNGIILNSPNGTQFKIKVNDDGTLKTEKTSLISKGNIGVVSSAQLLREWRKVIINIDEMILNDLEDLFMLLF